MTITLEMIFTHVDLIAIPDFSAGAMENWGLITYRLTSLLSNPSDSSTSNQQWVITVVAHELAHQVLSRRS
jgi:aminopeptidase N